MKKGQRSGIYTECISCGKEVYRYKSQIAKAKRGRRYCSNECYRKSRSSVLNPNWKGKTESRMCKACGSEFNHLPTVGRENRGRYCSVTCKNKSIKGNGWVQQKSLSEARSLFDEYRTGYLSFDAFSFQKGISSSALRKLFISHWPDEYASATDSHRASINITYRRGRAFEYAVMRFLQAANYWCLRSPASRGPADIVAIRKGEVLLVQCKSGNGKLRKQERISLVCMAVPIGATPLLACRPKRGEILFLECTTRYQEMREWKIDDFSNRHGT